MAIKFQPDNELLAAHGFKVLRGVPFIVSEDMKYYQSENRFLREAKLGRWINGADMRSSVRRGAKGGLAINTINAYADHLVNFLSWCEEHDGYTGILDIDEDGLDEYADDMEEGVWSLDQTALSPDTICLRLSTVINATEFAIARDLRPPYEFTKVERSYQHHTSKNSHAGVTRYTNSYAIIKKRRKHPSQMILPSKAEIRKFISMVDDPAKEIGARLIFFCGLRIDEIENLKDKSFPTLRQVENKYGHTDVEVPVKIIGKGDKERKIYVPGKVIELIETYRKNNRKKHLRGSPSNAAQAALLHNYYGDPLSKSALRKTWDAVRKAMVDSEYSVEDLTPHVGRHAFAVYWLTQQITRDVELTKNMSLKDMPLPMIKSQGEAHLVELRNILGHEHLHTTQKYLEMVPDKLHAEMNISRQLVLDDDEDTDSHG